MALLLGTLDTRAHLVDLGFARLDATTCEISSSFAVMGASCLLPARTGEDDRTSI